MDLGILFTIGTLVSMVVMFALTTISFSRAKLSVRHRCILFGKIALYAVIVFIFSVICNISVYNTLLWCVWVVGSDVLLVRNVPKLPVVSGFLFHLFGFGSAYLMELIKGISDTAYFFWTGFFGATCLAYIGMSHAFRLISLVVQATKGEAGTE